MLKVAWCDPGSRSLERGDIFCDCEHSVKNKLCWMLVQSGLFTMAEKLPGLFAPESTVGVFHLILIALVLDSVNPHKEQRNNC